MKSFRDTKTDKTDAAEHVRDDAKGQFVRSRKGGDPKGLHSANPVVTSGNGDATDEIKSPDRPRKR